MDYESNTVKIPKWFFLEEKTIIFKFTLELDHELYLALGFTVIMKVVPPERGLTIALWLC